MTEPNNVRPLRAMPGWETDDGFDPDSPDHGRKATQKGQEPAPNYTIACSMNLKNELNAVAYHPKSPFTGGAHLARNLLMSGLYRWREILNDPDYFRQFDAERAGDEIATIVAEIEAKKALPEKYRDGLNLAAKEHAWGRFNVLIEKLDTEIANPNCEEPWRSYLRDIAEENRNRGPGPTST